MASMMFLVCSAPAILAEEAEILVESVPKWHIGQGWTFQTDKSLDRTASQNAGLLVITTRLERVAGTTTYTVSGTEQANGETCYVLDMTGSQEITGRYSTTPIEGEAVTGNLIQKSTFEGKP